MANLAGLHRRRGRSECRLVELDCSRAAMGHVRSYKVRERRVHSHLTGATHHSATRAVWAGSTSQTNIPRKKYPPFGTEPLQSSQVGNFRMLGPATKECPMTHAKYGEGIAQKPSYLLANHNILSTHTYSIQTMNNGGDGEK
ncbi:peroxiredoxin [Anopheles sinensis]|uniref:Peroxiredoxin n=1 Tax=Anopheles sinensis TaxID=74873 RepID=A0A084VZM9_ANOSI|nr:peroxiredoxin [Anopheles sinensis]